MATLIIDGRQIEIPDGQRLNVIEAARRAGIEIPHYCYHPGLPVVGSCRMCLVEIGNRDAKTGRVSMQPKLVPGCTAPATDGLVVVTGSQKVRQARAMVEEGLLLRHPIDCPICDKAGECLLQDYYFKYGQSQRRADLMPFTSRRRDLGDVTLFVDRCILCTRCVRFCDVISGTNELMVTDRGAREEIDVVAGHPLHNNLSGNVVDLCPVGALADKDFLYRQRVWFLSRHAGVCTGCASGCSIWIEENQDRDLPAETPGEPAGQQVVDVQRGPLRLPSRTRPAAAHPAAPPAGGLDGRDWIGRAWPPSSRSGCERPAGWRGCCRPYSASRRPSCWPRCCARSIRRPCWPWGPCRAARPTSASRAGSWSRPRRPPIAAAWKRSLPTSPIV